MTPSAVRGHVVAAIAGDRGVVILCKARVYADAAPRDCAFPHITVQRTSHARERTQDGFGATGATGLHVAVWADDPASRDAVAEAVRGVLYAMRDGGGDLEYLAVVGDVDAFEWVDDAGPGGWYTARFDCRIGHQVVVAA